MNTPLTQASRKQGLQIKVSGVKSTSKFSQRTVSCRAEASDEKIQLAAGVGGILAAPLCLYSEYVLKTTGSGIPDGPGGLFGALEGISYLVVVGLVGWSAYTKAQTGSGLPAGPSGLLGGAEGLSYLALLGGIIVFGLNALGL